MKKMRIAFFLALAAALATGMALLAVLTAEGLQGWLSTLPANQAKLVTPALVVLTALFLALAGYIRIKREPGGDG
jgi:hypothetical protein